MLSQSTVYLILLIIAGILAGAYLIWDACSDRKHSVSSDLLNDEPPFFERKP